MLKRTAAATNTIICLIWTAWCWRIFR